MLLMLAILKLFISYSDPIVSDTKYRLCFYIFSYRVESGKRVYDNNFTFLNHTFIIPRSRYLDSTIYNNNNVIIIIMIIIIINGRPSNNIGAQHSTT